MKTFSAPLQAALASGDVIAVAAVKVATAEPFLVWGGYELLTLDGDDYVGIGSTGMVTVTGGQLGGTEQALVLSLSGVDPDVIPLIEQADVRRAPAAVWRLFFDGNGATLLGAHIYARGRVDGLTIDETPGGEANIRCSVETAARGMGRQTGRMGADADHRMIDATDGAFRFVTAAPSKTLSWGGKPPARAMNALPNTEGMLRDYVGGLFR